MMPGCHQHQYSLSLYIIIKTFRRMTLSASYETGENQTSSTQQQVGRKYKPDATAGAFGLIGYQLTTNAASRAVANRREDDDQNILDSEHYLLGQKVRRSI